MKLIRTNEKYSATIVGYQGGNSYKNFFQMFWTQSKVSVEDKRNTTTEDGIHILGPNVWKILQE